jgi:hypothetical protein
MPRNRYFTENAVVNGAASEQNLLENLIIESMQIYGVDMYYIPRILVAKDNILGEDRLSEFREAFPIEVYFENVDSFDGQGSFIQKFGLFNEATANVSVARKRWLELVGSQTLESTYIPDRPAEGDLLYFPLTKSLFEIKFVQHENPFYQLGRLYVYRLSIELFQYGSENIETGIEEIDNIEIDKSFDINVNSQQNSERKYGADNTSYEDESDGIINTFEKNPFGDP